MNDNNAFFATARVDAEGDLRALTAPSLAPTFWRAERLGSASAWWEHVPFGHWVVCATRPRVLVELGTDAGVSYAAFCQAVARSGLHTRCYAVDTWQGDPQAGLDGEEVFADFRSFHDERYSAFSTLLRTTFDQALAQFVSGTVDLLHIDGLHSYEAVRHDFESWKPKLSQQAIVLFHDTNEHGNDFGVWRLWAELTEQYPHFEFLHGHGLGVLAVGENVEPPISVLCGLSDPSLIAALRTRFSALGQRCHSQACEQMLVQDLGLRGIGEQAEILRQCIAKSTEMAEQARIAARRAEAQANAWEARARESERAHEQTVHRMNVARRDVYDANLRAEKAQASAEQAETRANQAQTERHLALQELDAMLHSATWQATWPIRAAGHRLPSGLRRVLRGALKLGWWSLTLKLSRKLRERSRATATPPMNGSGE